MHPFRAAVFTLFVIMLAGLAVGQDQADSTLSIESSTITAHDTLTVKRLVHRGMVWRKELEDELFVVADVVLRLDTTSDKQVGMRVEEKTIKLTDAAGREYPMVGTFNRYGNFTTSTSNFHLYATAKWSGRQRIAPVFMVPKDATGLTLHAGTTSLEFDMPASSPEPQPDDAIKFEVTGARFLDDPFELKTRIWSSAEAPYVIEPAFGRWARVSVRVSMPKPPRPGIRLLGVRTQDMAILCKGMVLGAAATEKDGTYYPRLHGTSLAAAGAEPADGVFFVALPEDASEFELLYLNRKVARGTIAGGRPVKTPAAATPALPAKIPEIPKDKTPPEKTSLEIKVVDVHVQNEIHAYPQVHVPYGVRHRVREPGIKYAWFELAMITHWGKDDVRGVAVKKEEIQLIDAADNAYANFGDMEDGGDGELYASSYSNYRPSDWQHKLTKVRRCAPLFAVPADMTKATLKMGAFEQEVTLPPVKPAIQPSDMAAFRIADVEFVEPAPFELRLGGKRHRVGSLPTTGRWVKISFMLEGLRPNSLGFDRFTYSTHDFGLWYDGAHRIAVAQPFGKTSTVQASTTSTIKGAKRYRAGGGSCLFILPEDASGDIVLTYQLSPVAQGKIAAP